MTLCICVYRIIKFVFAWIRLLWLPLFAWLNVQLFQKKEMLVFFLPPAATRKKEIKRNRRSDRQEEEKTEWKILEATNNRQRHWYPRVYLRFFLYFLIYSYSHSPRFLFLPAFFRSDPCFFSHLHQHKSLQHLGNS